MLLGQMSDHEVLAHYDSIDQLLQLGNALKPDCLMLDYHMPGAAPILSLHEITKHWPAALLVFLTGTRSVAVLQRIIESPVNGIFHKQDSADSIISMLARLSGEQQVISDSIIEQVKSLDCGFSAKEFDVLFLLVQGKSPAQIAEQLCVSKRTIEKHQENMMRKASVSNLAQLIELGHRLSILE